MSVEDLYRQILGREAEQEGLQYWQQQFGGDVDPNEIAQFTAAAQPELQARGMGSVAPPAPEPPKPFMQTSVAGPYQDDGRYVDIGRFQTFEPTKQTPARDLYQDDGRVVDVGMFQTFEPTPPTRQQEPIYKQTSNYDQVSGYESWIPGGGGNTDFGFGGDRGNHLYEFSDRAAQAAPAGGLNAVRNQINQMYRDVLGRDADAEGLQYWTERFGGPLTADDRALWMSIAKPDSHFDANQVTALGDSTTRGYNMGDRVGTNMTDAAQQILGQDLGRDIQINNMGVDGSSLGDAIARGDVDKALNDSSPTVLLNYGMNEAYRNEDPAQFQKNLEAVVKEMKAAGKDVVLQTPNYTEAIPGVNKYADIVRNVASKYDVNLHDKWDLTSGLYNTYNPQDPVHPTEAVYRYLGTSLADVLRGKYRKA